MSGQAVSTAPSTSAWIRRFHPAPEAPSALVCFPHAGGTAAFYHPVSQAMAPHVDVLAIQYPGRQDRVDEPCIDDLETLAELVTHELSAWTSRPLTLLGHSMGAVVAFEVARRLEQRGATVLGLFASGARAPSLTRSHGTRFVDDATLINDLQRLGGTDPRLVADDAILRMALPALRGDYRAIANYRYTSGRPLRCPVTALAGDRDPLVPAAQAAAWERHSGAAFRLRVFAGGHFFLRRQVAAITQLIGDHIAAALRRRP